MSIAASLINDRRRAEDELALWIMGQVRSSPDLGKGPLPGSLVCEERHFLVHPSRDAVGIRFPGSDPGSVALLDDTHI